MNQLPGRYILTIVASLLLMTSCQMDKFDLSDLSEEKEIGQEWAAPLIRGELTMDDLLETFDSTGVFDSEPNGLLYLVYTDSLFSKTAEDNITLPNQDYFDLLYQVPYTINNFNSTITRTIDTMHRVTFENGAKLDSIITDNFTLKQYITSDIQHDITLILTYKDVVKNGQPLIDTISIAANETPYDEIVSRDLSNYTIKTLPPDTSDYNYFRLHYDVTIEGSGNDLNQNNELSIQNMVENVNMQSAYGYIGQDTLMLESADIPVNLFKETDQGSVEFAEPVFKFLIDNSYGVPIEIELSNAKAYREGGMDTTDIIFDPTANPFDINYPTLSEIGESKETTIKISNDNCNLSEALATSPTQIAFTSRGLSNPQGESGPYNFVTENSKFDVCSEIYLPLHLRADSLSLRDTSELDLSDMLSDSTDMIKQVISKFNVKNGLPADIDFQVYFLDQNNQMVDTLFNADDRPVIEAAPVDDNDEVVSTTNKTAEMTFNENQISDLGDVRNAVFEATLTTSDFENTMVKFYTDYTVEFDMNIEIKTNLDLNE